MKKNVVAMKCWPTTVRYSSVDELLEKKKNQRKIRISETKEKINKLRGK